jgi:hypothetical protein
VNADKSEVISCLGKINSNFILIALLLVKLYIHSERESCMDRKKFFGIREWDWSQPSYDLILSLSSNILSLQFYSILNCFGGSQKKYCIFLLILLIRFYAELLDVTFCLLKLKLLKKLKLNCCYVCLDIFQSILIKKTK